jgi:hypothetical protein
VRADIILLVLLCGCGTRQPEAKEKTVMTAEAWPADWGGVLGKTITLEGKPQEAKMGPVLVGEGREIWISGLEEWPPGAKRVRVTGVVIERNDLPVFVPDDGGLQKGGMPVAPGTDLEAASHRYLLDVHEVVAIER